MDSSNDRQHHQQRAVHERAMAAASPCVEATIAHEALTKLHVAECRACVHGRTAECVDCDLAALCETQSD